MEDLPKLTSIEPVSTGWINKYLLTFRMPDGSDYTYESVSRKRLDAYTQELENNAAGVLPKPDAVCIVPIIDNERLLIIREFRYPLNSWCIAFPAGLLEDGETIAECVTRELGEETGYRVCREDEFDGPAIVQLAQTGYSSTGLAEENVQVVFAHVVPDGTAKAHPESSEFIETFELPFDDVKQFLRDNVTPIGTRCQLVLELIRCVWTLMQGKQLD